MTRPNFRQPVAEREVRLETSVSADLQRHRDIVGTQHQVKVFCIPGETRVVAQSISATNQELDPPANKKLHDALVECCPFFGSHL